jgi:hypothetical protein
MSTEQTATVIDYAPPLGAIQGNAAEYGGDPVTAAVLGLQRDANTLLTNAIRGAVQDAERRGYERAVAEHQAAEERRQEAAGRLGATTGLLKQLREVLGKVQCAQSEAEAAVGEVDSIEGAQSDSDNFDVHVDTDSLPDGEVPAGDETFDEVRAFLEEHAGDRVMSHSDLARCDVEITCNVDVSEAREHATSADLMAAEAIDLLETLIDNLEDDESEEEAA